MSFFGGPVDVLATLSDKLKQMLNETREHYSSFVNFNQQYNNGNMNETEFFDKITAYLVTVSALNFLAIRVILELKSAMDKGTSVKDVTGGVVASTSTSPFHQDNFGVGAFVGTGGTAGAVAASPPPSSEELQQPPTLTPVYIEIPKSQKKNNSGDLLDISADKKCKVCAAIIPRRAKFCTKCGNPQ
jgi:hypothetical protein